MKFAATRRAKKLDERRRAMRFFAEHDIDLRRTEQAVSLDVPTSAAQHFVARRGEAGEVGDGGPADETD